MFKGQKIIALCMSKIHDDGNFEFVSALEQSARTSGYRLFIYHTCSDLYWKTKNEAGERAIFDLIHYEYIDALLIDNKSFADKSVVDMLCEKAIEHNIPAIMVNGSDSRCINFVFDYHAGFELLVRHIVTEHKVRDVHMIAGMKGEVYSELRISTFKKVLDENNIEFNDDMLSYGDYWSGPTQDIVENMVMQGRVPKAIMCANDVMAITTTLILQDNGIRVPEDVIVTGFDGIEEAYCCVPMLTTCGYDYTYLTDRILYTLEDRELERFKGRIYNIPAKPFISESCGCRKESKHNTGVKLMRQAKDKFIKYQGTERILYEISERIMTDANRKTLVKQLKEYAFPNTTIALNPDVLDAKSEPYISDGSISFNDKMEILIQDESDTMVTFDRKDILPNIDKILELDHPVIFTALNNVDVLLGFYCFYSELENDVYCCIPQYVTAVNNIIGNYRNIKYQQYIARRMERIYQTDALTGLYNRTGFYKELEFFIQKANDYQSSTFMVICMDLDGLKKINDVYGHIEGDFAISSVAKAVLNVDLPGKLCARFGGDEMVICALLQDKNIDVEEVRQEIRNQIVSINLKSGKPYTISASIGISICEADKFDFEKVFKIADKEMYCEKYEKAKRRHN